MRTQVVPFHQRPLTRHFPLQQKAAAHGLHALDLPPQLLAQAPLRASGLLLGRRNPHHAERLAMAGKIFAEPQAHHLRVELVVDLVLALLIPVLRRDHVNFRSHRLHAPGRLIPKAARLVAYHHPIGQMTLLLQPGVKGLGRKLLCRLRPPLIDLPHHPIAPQVHVDRNLDQCCLLQ
jgi:hypothetical protein